MWRRVVVVVAVVAEAGGIDDGEKEQRRASHDKIRWWQPWWRGCDFPFLCFSEMFVVRDRICTIKKINVISMFCNFFAVLHLDAR
jgi:hypothetical protein